MTSWRDTASAQAQTELDELLGAVLPMAQQTLRKHGELLPYAATIDGGGNQSLVATDIADHDALPSSHDVLASLYEAARNSAQGLRAVAFVAAVRLTDESAVRVELEHCEGVSMTVLIPYDRDRGAGAIGLGQPRATAGIARVWPTTR